MPLFLCRKLAKPLEIERDDQDGKHRVDELFGSTAKPDMVEAPDQRVAAERFAELKNIGDTGLILVAELAKPVLVSLTTHVTRTYTTEVV